MILNLALKQIIMNVRPHDISPKLTDAGWYSFPSGHAMMATMIFGFGAYLLARTLRGTAARRAVIAAGVTITLVVGVSRVYLGAHWPSDALGTYAICLSWLAAAFSAAGVPQR